MDRTFTIVVNPAAGGGKAYQCMQATQTVLDAAGVRYQAHHSKSLTDAGSLEVLTLTVVCHERPSQQVLVKLVSDGMGHEGLISVREQGASQVTYSDRAAGVV
ncbi:MAG: hypothetical protein ACRDOL_35665, partial [Streptosporangiaceae bacterium]